MAQIRKVISYLCIRFIFSLFLIISKSVWQKGFKHNYSASFSRGTILQEKFALLSCQSTNIANVTFLECNQSSHLFVLCCRAQNTFSDAKDFREII